MTEIDPKFLRYYLGAAQSTADMHWDSGKGEFGSLEDAVGYAVELRELETELLRSKARLAWEMVDQAAERVLAETWGCSTYSVRTLAAIAQLPDELIDPTVPMSLYRAAIETDDPEAWLRRAIKEGWSARQLRDAADIRKGRRVSRAPLLRARAEVQEWRPDAVVLRPRDWAPSGEEPREVEVEIREVLEKGDE